MWTICGEDGVKIALKRVENFGTVDARERYTDIKHANPSLWHIRDSSLAFYSRIKSLNLIIAERVARRYKEIEDAR